MYRIVIWLFLTLLLSVGGQTQTAKVRTPVQPADHNWLVENWSGNDTVFAASRERIDQRLQDHSLSAADLKSYKVSVEQTPQNSQAVFDWAYANYVAQKTSLLQGDIVSIGIFADAPSPKSYNYARLRFLIAARDKPSAQLDRLGERLLRKNNKDFDVQ